MGHRRSSHRTLRRFLAAAAVLLAMTSGCASPTWPWSSRDSGAAKTISGQPKSSLAGEKPSTSQADADSLKQVMSELQQVGAIDPAAQEKLMADLKNVDPSHWPMILQTFRAEAAYKRRLEQREGQRQKEEAAATEPDHQDSGSPSLASARNQKRREMSTASASPLPGEAVARGTEDAVAAVAPLPGPTAVVSPDDQNPLAPERPLDGASTSSVDIAAAKAGRMGNGPREPDANPPSGPTAAKPAEAVAKQASPLTVADQLAAIRRETATNAALSAGFSSPRSVSPLADADWQSHLTAAIRAIETESKADPSHESDIALQARLRMLYLLAGHRDEAMRPLPAAPQAAQDYWSSQIYGLSTWMDAEKTPDMGRRAAATKRILEDALAQLGETAPLTLRNLTFCTDVYRFGAFAAVKSTEFSPGQKVLLYAEIDNLHVVSSARGYRWAVKISGQVFDGRGSRMADFGSTEAEETFQTPRHDFFVSKLYLLPRLSAGHYNLQLTIEDTLGHKVGQSSIDFTIKPQ